MPALIVFLTGLIYPFIWQWQGRSSNRQAGSRNPADPVKWATVRFLLCYGIAIDLNVVMERTPTIRSSLREVERTLAISTATL